MLTSLILAAALSGSPLFVESLTPSNERVVAVRTADLDLARDSDRARLQTRLQSAVSRVCPPPDYNGVREHMLLAECRQTAKLSAQRAMAEAIASHERRPKTLAAASEIAEMKTRK